MNHEISARYKWAWAGAAATCLISKWISLGRLGPLPIEWHRRFIKSAPNDPSKWLHKVCYQTQDAANVNAQRESQANSPSS